MGSWWPDMVSTSGARIYPTQNVISKCLNISCNVSARCEVMATIRVPDKQIHLTEESKIRRFLHERGVFYERWTIGTPRANVTETEVLQVHDHWLKPFMEKNGYRTADVIRVTPKTPNLSAIRDKFLREHTHSEDEVR